MVCPQNLRKYDSFSPFKHNVMPRRKGMKQFALIPDQIVVEINSTLRVLHYQHGSKKIHAQLGTQLVEL